jgi:hypothetical protein
MTPNPSFDRGPVSVDDACRWQCKAVELVRLMYVAGFDVDAELVRLHRSYDMRRDTARIRMGLGVDEAKE